MKKEKQTAIDVQGLIATTAEEMTKCCLCGKKVKDRETNNPDPIMANGRCCSDCNRHFVIPLRMMLKANDSPS